MFYLEGIESEELHDLDEPLTMSMRHFRRQSSSVSGGSNEDETSHSYSSSSAGSATASNEAVVNFGDLLAPPGTMVNRQRDTTMSSEGYNVQQMKEHLKPVVPKKKGNGNGKRSKRRVESNLSASSFSELYYLTDEHLGRGSYATVQTCVHRVSGAEFAVKIIEKRPENSRTRVIKEIEAFHMCSGHANIVQLIEYFEDDDKFYLIFQKMRGGPLLNHIQRRICFTEHEACLVVRDIANALKFLHDRGIAHRDLKPENILCTYPDRVSPVKLCDLDLASKASSMHASSTVTTPELQSPVGSAEFMAPEVVDAFVGEALSYDKRCDLWSLGVILYILLCGYPPFYGECDTDDCGWDFGLPCQDCQYSLFSRIQKGNYNFPQEDWSHISGRAKELIRHLLVKDASRRYTVDDVLRHDWLQTQAPRTPLMTPGILMRKDSARDLAQLAGHFDAGNRFGWHEGQAFHIYEKQNVAMIGPAAITPITRKLTPVEQFQDMTIARDRFAGQHQKQ